VSTLDTDSLKVAQELATFVHTTNEKFLSPSQARNLLADKIKAQWIYFIDDDAFVPQKHKESFLKFLSMGNKADVVGGPNLTPPGSSFFKKVTGEVLASFWGAGPCHRRYAAVFNSQDPVECDDSALILCDLFLKKSTFEKIKFQEGYICGEENQWLSAAAREGYKLWHFSELYVFHERRAELPEFLSQIFKYGIGRGQNINRKNPPRIYHVLPALCLVFLAVSWSSDSAQLKNISGLFLVFYFLLNFLFSIKIGLKNPLSNWRQKIIAAAARFFLFPLVHGFYALGLLWALIFRK
jgi:hypothetical protein